MKVTGTIITIESMVEARMIWERPQDGGYVGGGQPSIRFAGWDYCSIDPGTPPSKSGVKLQFLTQQIETLYHTLCNNAAMYRNGYSFDFDTFEHTFPEGSDILKVLVAYANDPTTYTLTPTETDDDLTVVIENNINHKRLNLSVAGDSEEHSAYYLLLVLHDQAIDEVQQASRSEIIHHFLS